MMKERGLLAGGKETRDGKLAEEAYRLLLNHSSQGFAILQRGRILFCNDALAMITGYPRDELLGMSMEGLTLIVHADDRAYMSSVLNASVEGKSPGPDRRFRFIDKKGHARWVETNSMCVDFEGSPALLVTYMKVSQRQETETTLRESEERFRDFVEIAPVAINISRAGTIVYANTAYLRLYGIPGLEDVVGRHLVDLVAPACRKAVATRFMRNTRVELEEEEFEIEAKRLDGSLFACRVAVTVLVLSDGPATLAFFFDLSTQKEAEKKLEASQNKLRSLTVHLLHAREEERKTVAREIHDELGQILTAIKMDLRWIEKRFDPHAAVIMDKLHGVVGLADQTIQMVHRIASELRPGILDDLGLAAAIEWLGGDFSRRNGIPCRVDITSSEPAITGRNATALFRIIQEALTNVAHHAHASRASVELWEEDQTLLIRVQDDGIGITEAQSMSPSAFGLIGIRERVQGLRGDISILGKPDKGTTLMVTMPVPLEEAMA